MAPEFDTSPLRELVDDLEQVEALDGPSGFAAATVRGAIPQGTIKQALSGSWLGHALHPLLTDVVIGSFTSATLLDLLGGRRSDEAAERLIAIGIAAYGPTALTGASDWSDSESGNDAVRRVGFVHAVTNSVALSLYAASLIERRRGRRARGTLLGLAGATALGLAGYLGGHLTLSKGVGVEAPVPS